MVRSELGRIAVDTPRTLLVFVGDLVSAGATCDGDRDCAPDLFLEERNQRLPGRTLVGSLSTLAALDRGSGLAQSDDGVDPHSAARGDIAGR